MNEEKFTRLLMEWHQYENKRVMPWKGEKDPYKVWLSEIILQQTRVEQGWAYYERFVKKYPTITKLAKAKDEDVFKLWEGLGYYTRCKNLLFTARFINDNYSGKFPSTYEEIEALKGVGSYTASAIASFCFQLPYAVIDGNVFRILSRFFGIETAIDSTEGKKQFKKIADELLDKNQPGNYNQAIMDFGATVCKPMLPMCSTCTLNKLCAAYKTGSVNELPVKEKSLKKKTRWFSFIIFESDEKILIRKRTAKDIWQNLFEFYLIETESNPMWNKEMIADHLREQLGMQKFEVFQIDTAARQQLTHQLIKGYFIKIKLLKIPSQLKSENNIWVTQKELSKYPFPGFVNQYLQNKNAQTSLF